MAAKKRPTREGPPDLQESLRLYIHTSERIDELRQDALAALRAGKLRRARQLERAARELRDRLTAIEKHFKPPQPPY